MHILSDWVINRPKAIVLPQILLCLVSIFYTVTELNFSTERNDLVGSDKKYHQIFLQYREEFPQEDDLVTLVESGNQEKNRQFVERLAARLQSDPVHFTNVFWKGDLKSLGPKSLLFLDLETLQSFRDSIQTYLPILQFFSETESLNDLFKRINRRFAEAGQARQKIEAATMDSGPSESVAASSEEPTSLLSALPSLHTIIRLANDALARPGEPTAPPLSAFFPDESMDSGAGSSEGYITYDQGRIFLITCQAASAEAGTAAVKRLRMWTQLTEQEIPGVNVGITGEPILEYEEMQQSQRDTASASVLALCLVMVIFVFGYHETRRPIKTTLCLLVGLSFTMAFTTLTVGRLNILTITFAPILIGLSIDFGVHLVSRYEDELTRGVSPEKAIRNTLVHTGQGIVTGAFTTSLAFFAMTFTDFRGIQEMGIITGGGMMVSLIPMISLLPVWLLHGSRRTLVPAGLPVGNQEQKLPVRSRLERWWMTRPGMTIGVIGVITVVAIPLAQKVTFDYNLLNMQSKSLDAVEWEHKLIEATPKSALFAAVMTDSVLEARELATKALQLETVGSVDSMSSVLYGSVSDADTEENKTSNARLETAREIQIALADLTFSEPSDEPVSITELSRTLWSFQGYLGAAAEKTLNNDIPYLNQLLNQMKDSVIELRKQLFEKRSGLTSAERIQEFQQRFLNEIRTTFEALKSQDLSSPMQEEDLPAVLKSRFIGKTGKHLVYIYPKNNIWDRENQEEFILQLRSIAPNVTGTPIQLYEYTTLLKTSYEKAALHALIVITIVAFLRFRNLLDTLLCLAPVGIGFTWMLGCMGATAIPFNPANIMTLPLVVGIGVTNAIHILGKFHEDGEVSLFSGSAGKAVLVSGLTTIAGFGSLIMAEHRGISSLGSMMSLGTLACMLVALIAVPALLALIHGKKVTGKTLS